MNGKMIKEGIYRAWCFAFSHIFVRRYDKKYLTGAWFNGRAKGILSRGWVWVARDWRLCRKLGVNEDARFPVSPLIRVMDPENITFHPDDLNNFQGFGNYFQAWGGIEIGRGTYIAPNVGIITQNHDVRDPAARAASARVVLGEKCWIGMNAVILPGVTLGPHTVVGAGAVVTKSFPEGWCVVAGNPARMIRPLRPEEAPENAEKNGEIP